jgi:hypothetical protein
MDRINEFYNYMVMSLKIDWWMLVVVISY